MALADDLQSFLEARLLSLDPTIDLSAGSPAQTQVIQPTIDRFGEDPLAADVQKFFQDRMTQEFPELAADNAGQLEDLLSKPFQLLFSPFKREVERTRIGQSVNNAALMSDDEADALGANWFEPRNEGDFASGTVRLYYQAPTTSRVTTDKRCFTADGLSFFPTQNYFITAAQMVFNRQGNFYFLDISVRAEVAGDQYNVKKSLITGIEDVPGVIKVANLSDFVSGLPRESNEEYLGRFDQTLTERSLVTARGVLARLPQTFESIRALQVVGAGEEGMNRDILTGTGEGLLHIAGAGTVYGDWLFVYNITYRDDGEDDNIIPQAGDTVRFHAGYPAPSPTTVHQTTIKQVLTVTDGTYLFLLDTSPYASGQIVPGSYAILKPGTISISGVPGGIAADIQVADNTVHLGGHTDVFVRPTEDAEVQGVLENITDQDPLVAITDLVVPSAGNNRVQSASTDFEDEGVEPGDLLVIETGAGFAGTYRILEVETSTGYLRVDATFASATSVGVELRARVVKNLTVDLVEPRIPKLPFSPGPVSDLSTTVGSAEFKFATLNIQSFGAAVGDVIRILDGADAGDFTIQSFTITGSAIVDRLATSTGSGLRYEVFTALRGLQLPLIRVRSIEVLDSTNQTTGIAVPYGDAVDIRPTCDLEGAGKERTTYDKQLVVLPDLSGYWGTTASPTLPADPIALVDIDDTTDARYTLELAIAEGVVRTVTADASNQVEKVEVDVPPFMWNGKRDKLMALVSKTDPNYTGAGTHMTSDIAESKIGDSLTILDGPNQGKYIIKDLRILDLWGKEDQGHRKVAVIQVDPELKVDPIRTALNLIDDAGVFPWTAAQLFGFFEYAADWDNPSGFYTTFLTQLLTNLTASGVIFANVAALKEFFDDLIKTGYTVGPSAKGDFRMYFLEPVSMELNFGDTPTRFSSAADGAKTFRLSPDMDPAQILPESEVTTPPTEWNRNLGVRYPATTDIYLTSGSSLAKRGIRAGDTVEFYPAINDIPSRGAMSSSWMATTQLGSNLVQLILPPSAVLDNYAEVSPGHLLFIDSGPDIGAYTVVEVVEQDWISDPPVIKVRLDKTLTHTTEDFPSSAQADFSSFAKPVLLTTPMTFPLAGSLTGKTLVIGISTDGGSTFGTTKTHTFGAGPFNDVQDILDDIVAVGTLLAGGTLQAFDAGNDQLGIRTSANVGPERHLRVNASTSLAEGIGYTSLQRVQGLTGAAIVAEPSKRIYGSGLSIFAVGDFITLYAAQSPTSSTTPTTSDQILADGEDEAYLGTFEVVAIGTETEGEQTDEYFVELDRSSDFPALRAQVRWIRMPEEPENPVAETSGGGKEISSQYVRFRLYDDVSLSLDIASIPWSASPHPLLSTSEQQAVLESPGLIASSQANFSHMSPYRVVRDGVFRISSTNMALKREGALYYVDVPVIGYGPGAEMNIPETEGFVLDGTYDIAGYTLRVADENFVYSSQERVDLIIPNAVLPVGSTPELDNEFNLAGQNIQVTYNNAPLVDDIQRFLEAPLDRVTAANMLARHFIPAYVLLDASYVGGATEDQVAAEIISYINNIDPSVNEIRTDLIQDIIKRRGASRVTLPITLIALIHGTDRRIRGMRSQEAIGINDTPLFQGTFKQTYFIAGDDTSKTSPRPDGEQVFLKRS